MAHVRNEGCSIHYAVESAGPALVLHHWSFASLEFWYDFEYVRALKDDVRLVLVDSRRHGRSGAPHDPSAYRPRTHVNDITAVLDDLRIERAHFFGYSMGWRFPKGLPDLGAPSSRQLQVLGVCRDCAGRKEEKDD